MSSSTGSVRSARVGSGRGRRRRVATTTPQAAAAEDPTPQPGAEAHVTTLRIVVLGYEKGRS